MNKGADGNNWIKEVYDKKFGNMCNTATRFLGNKEIARDVVQDIFARFLTTPPDIESIRNLEGFLYIAVRNACYNTIKGLQREQGLINDLKNNNPPTDIQDEDEETRFKVLDHIFEQINSLPTRRQEICRMVLFEKLSTAEIAARLGIAEQTVLNQKNIGFHQIKTALLKNKLLYAFIFFIQLAEQ
jgi:RNA polymerase sigma factor (sigma-70 family)